VQVRVEQASCGHCGAPLPLSSGAVLVCRFCGRESRVAAPHLPPPYVPHATSRAPKSKAPLLLALGLGIASLAGFVLFGFGMRWFIAQNATSTAKHAEGRARAGIDLANPHFWFSDEPALLASREAVPPIAGIAGWLDGRTELVLLSGMTGQVLWHVPAPNSLDVYADGGDILMSFDPAKKVTRYDVATGKATWSIAVADHVHDITFGRACASVLFGGKPFGLDAGTGAERACTARREPRLGRYKLEAQDVEFRSSELDIVGSLELDNKALNPAPPRFAISARRNQSALWKTVPGSLEPIWTSDGFHRSVVLTPAGVFVFGRSPSDHTARWLLLDTSTGKTLYEKQGRAKVDSGPRVAVAGPLVYVVHDNRLEAYRAASGELAWAIAN
jgi:hypothetical protein